MPVLRTALAFVFLASLACGAQCVAAEVDGSVQEALRAQLERMECPGALVGVRRGDAAAEAYVLGVADVDTRQPMQRDFRMRIASVTKPFVGTAVLLLVDEGQLSLDDPISKYVADVPDGDSITLRQLGNNTSGIFNTIENKDFQAEILANPQRSWTANEIIAYALAKPAYHKPRAAWRYSNTNAVLLSKVIDRVAGMPHEEFIQQRVIQPLGLEHTGFVSGASLPRPAPHGYRNGYEDKWLGYGETFYDVTDYSASWTGAAGNMFSTLDDLLAAAKPLVQGQLISEAARLAMQQWVDTGHHGIGYGFCLAKKNGWVGHTGDVPGFSAYLGYSPEHDATIVVLANLSNARDGTNPAEVLRDELVTQLNLEEK